MRMSNLKNLVPCCINVFKQKPDSEGYYIEPTKNQMIDKLLEQHDKLTKYKRAFEILKEKLELDISERTEFIGYLLYTGLEPVTISREQYELLEELMKGE
jgi:hypothetical protein